MTPQDGYHNLNFDNVWRLDVSPYQDSILQMWARNGGPVGPEAQKRLNQLVLVIRDQAGEVMGVSTAFNAYIKQLRNHFFIVRLMIAPEKQSPGLSSHLLVLTRDFLESVRSRDRVDDPIGLVMLVEKARTANITSEAIWPTSKMVYIGNTAEGHHIRVYYFKGARIAP